MPEKWFYGRVSSAEQQEDRNALKKQLERGQNAGCDRFFWDIQSRTTEVRVGLQQLIDSLKLSSRGAVAELIVTRIDRIGSSSKLFYSLLEVLRGKGIRLVALDQTIDTESLGGELTIDILLAASKFEIKMLSSRVSAERKHRISQGKSHRLAPLGWKVECDRYVKDESGCVCLIESKRSFKVWELTLFIFDVFEDCGSVRSACEVLNQMFGTSNKIENSKESEILNNAIASDLAELDLSSKNKMTYRRYPWIGLQWSPAGLKNFLANPVHAGGTPYNLTKKGGAKNTKRLKHFDQWDCNWGTHEGIITRDRHEQVKRIIRNNANNKWAAQSADQANPFANLLKCGRCGGAVTRMSSRRDRSNGYTAYYQCTYYSLGRCKQKQMVTNHYLEKQVFDLMAQEAVRLAAGVVLEEDTEEISPEIAELRESLLSLEKLPSNPFVDSAMLGIQAKITDLLHSKSIPIERSLIVREKIVQMFGDRERWDYLNPKDKKLALSRLVRRIILDGRVVLSVEFR